MTLTTDETVVAGAPADTITTPAAGNGDRFAQLEAAFERSRVQRDGWTIFMFTFSAVALIAAVVGVGFGLRAMDEADSGGSATGGATGAATGAATGEGAAHQMTADEMDAAMRARTEAFPAKTAGTGGKVLQPKVLANGTKVYELTAEVVQWEIEPGKFVEAWTYNGTVPGPTIKVGTGDRVRVVLHNELPESTVIHIHGIDIPNALDGVPDITQAPVKPGDSFTYEFTAQSTPAVGMYHSHHNAAKQVNNGLAGALLIGRVDTPAGIDVSQEQVMMLNDAGTLGYSINGKSFPATAPFVAAPGEWILMHYMNEGQLAHPMHLHGPAQMVVAKDGFPVPEPYLADTVLVAPGERYSVLVQAREGVWAWHCHILSHAEREDGMFGMVTALVSKAA